MRISINFSSREYLLARKVYLTLAVGLLLAVAVFALNYSSYRTALDRGARLAGEAALMQKRQTELDASLVVLKKKVNVSDLASAARQADFANMAIRRRSFSWTAFLNRLEDVVPPGVGITDITPNFQTLDVDIAGKARSVAHVTELIQRLGASGYFEDIPPVFHTSEEVVDKDTGETIQTFSLKIRYRPDGPPAKARQAASAGRGAAH